MLWRDNSSEQYANRVPMGRWRSIMGTQENGVGGTMQVGDLVEGFSSNVVGLNGDFDQGRE